MLNTEQPSFHTLAEMFLKLYRENSQITVEEFAEKHPHARDAILDEFPALMLAEVLKGTSTDPKKNGVDHVPTKLGQYQIKSLIGRGGMGIVYAARHLGLEKDVAIKMLPLANIRTPSILQRFHVEARASAAMDHPNIVPVYDHGLHDQYAYLVMKRIRGVSLDMLVDQLGGDSSAKGKSALTLDWLFISGIGSQIASALKYAHEQGVIHRDIKPANMILDQAGKTWVTDFGLAKVRQSELHLSMTGDVVGTPRYMAPEQLRGTCDARSDIYGLGLTLYELASGQVAWSSLSGNQLLTERSSLELPEIREINPAIPDSLANIIMTACAMSPEDRYQSAGELSYVLNRFSHGDPVADRRRRPASERLRVYRKRSLAGAAAIVCCVASLTAWGVTKIYEPENPYQDRESALKILEDDEVRGRFVRELPGLLTQLITADDPRVRSVVAGVAGETIENTIKSIPASPSERQMLLDELGQLEQPFLEGRVESEQFAQKLNEVTARVQLRFQRLQLAGAAVADSGLSSSERRQAIDSLQELARKIAEGKIDGQYLQEIEKSVFEVAERFRGEGQVQDELIRQAISRLGELNQQFAAAETDGHSAREISGEGEQLLASSDSRQAATASSPSLTQVKTQLTKANLDELANSREINDLFRKANIPDKTKKRLLDAVKKFQLPSQ